MQEHIMRLTMALPVVVCVGLLMGCVEAQFLSLTTAISRAVDDSGTATFSQSLWCPDDARVYLVRIQNGRNGSICSCPGAPKKCPVYDNNNDIRMSPDSCRTAAKCNVTFSTPQLWCDANPYPAIEAYYIYVCAPVNPTLSINNDSVASGTTLTAGYSAAGNTASGRNASWVCSVEASDCSRVNVTLLLVIRNGNNQISSFSLPAMPRVSLGSVGMRATEGIIMTPFKVVLNVLSESLLQIAYMAIKAENSITVTCGHQTTSPPTRICIASPAEQQPQSPTSVVGPAVGGAVAALVVIGVVVVVVVVVVIQRRRSAQKAAGGESGDGESPGRQRERDDVTLIDVTGGRKGQARQT